MSSTEPPHPHLQAAAVPVNPHAVIRALRPADRARHDELVAELDRLHHEALPSLIKPPAQARVPDDDFAQRLSDPLVFLRGYELDGLLVGMIRAVLEEKPEGRAHHASRLVWIDDSSSPGKRAATASAMPCYRQHRSGHRRWRQRRSNSRSMPSISRRWTSIPPPASGRAAWSSAASWRRLYERERDMPQVVATGPASCGSRARGIAIFASKLLFFICSHFDAKISAS